MSRSLGLIAATSILGATSFTGTARADRTAPIDDTASGRLGPRGPDPNAAEKPPVSAGVAANMVGHVTYASTRVDVPVSQRWSIIPQAALLYIAPYAAGDPTVLVPYVGGGIG